MAGFYILCAVPADCKKNVSDETSIAYGLVSLTAAYLAVDFCSMCIVDVLKGWRDVDKGIIAPGSLCPARTTKPCFGTSCLLTVGQ
eukprot:1653517-Amphidinium_carterae.1